MVFRESPISFMAIRETIIEIGMELPTIREAFKSPKNSQITAIEITTAKTSVSTTDFRASFMVSELSLTISRFKPLCRSIRSAARLLTWVDSSIAVLLCCLVISILTVGAPLYRAILSSGLAAIPTSATSSRYIICSPPVVKGIFFNLCQVSYFSLVVTENS